jgi:outer membrane immunogenic protein
MGLSKFAAVALAIGAIAGSSAASAADMPAHLYTKAPMAAIYDWTGFYVGAEGGGSWGRSHQVDATTGLANNSNYDVNGGFGGMTVGYNWQASTWVFGLEGDISGSSANGSSVDNGPAGNPALTSFTKQEWLGTIRGRIGYAANSALLYVAGGYAVAGTKSGVEATATSVVLDTQQDTRNGWTVGAGVEWGFLPQWSAKAEYLYVKLEDKAFATANLGPAFNRSAVTLDENLFRVGVNYRFAGPLAHY